MVVARYNLFTRRQQQGETFEDWYCDLRRLYDLAEANEMTGDDLLTVLITTGIRDEKVRSKIFEDFRTPTLDETVKLIEQMVYAKDTTARIEKRREDSKVAGIGSSNSSKRPSKTSYQKDKEGRRWDKGNVDSKNKTNEKSKDKCNYCGRDRHPNGGGKFGWRESCPAKNASCKECKKTGHFANTPACQSKRVNCIKIESVHSATSTNLVNLKVNGPKSDMDVEAEADTGANITVFKGDMLQDMDWVNLANTNVHIKGYDGTAKSCLGKSVIDLKLGNKIRKEEIFFSNSTTSNFLSRDACMALGIIPKGFSYEQVHAVKLGDQNGVETKDGQKPVVCI